MLVLCPKAEGTGPVRRFPVKNLRQKNMKILIYTSKKIIEVDIFNHCLEGPFYELIFIHVFRLSSIFIGSKKIIKLYPTSD